MGALKSEVGYITPTNLVVGVVVGLLAVVAGGFGLDLGLNNGTSTRAIWEFGNAWSSWWGRVSEIIERPAPTEIDDVSYYMRVTVLWEPFAYGIANVALLPESWGFVSRSDFTRPDGPRNLQKWREDAAARLGQLVVCSTARSADLLAAKSTIRSFAVSDGDVGPLIQEFASTNGVKPNSCQNQQLHQVELPTEDGQDLIINVTDTYPCIELFAKFKIGSNILNGESTHDWFVYDKFCLTFGDNGTFDSQYNGLEAHAYDAGTDSAMTYNAAPSPTSPPDPIQPLNNTGALSGLSSMIAYSLSKR